MRPIDPEACIDVRVSRRRHYASICHSKTQEGSNSGRDHIYGRRGRGTKAHVGARGPWREPCEALRLKGREIMSHIAKRVRRWCPWLGLNTRTKAHCGKGFWPADMFLTKAAPLVTAGVPTPTSAMPSAATPPGGLVMGIPAEWHHGPFTK